MAVFEQDFLVGVRDIDSNLKITNKTLLGMFEDAGSSHSDTIGCGVGQIKETGLSWVIMHWKVKLYRRAEYGEKITVRTWIAGMRKLYMFRQYEVIDQSGAVIAAAASKWVLTDRSGGAVKIPEWIIEGYGRDERTVFDDYKIEKLTEPESLSSEYVYAVPCSAIDFNGHMNNLYYLDAAADAMEPEKYLHSDFNYFEIMYKKESTLGEKLKCRAYEDGGRSVFVIKTEDERHVHAIVLLQCD